jgi:hypothetical protein
MEREDMQVGCHYKFKHEEDLSKLLVYVGYNWSGNGRWHQFELKSERGKVWCEITDNDLRMIEEA